MKKIITLTVNPALDIYTTVEQLEPGKKLRCREPRLDPGGGGVNVSRVIHRLGGKTLAIYAKGGCAGSTFAEFLDKEEVAQEPVEIENDLRQNFSVFETGSGKLYRFGMPGAKLKEGEYEKILQKLDNIQDAEFLVASGSLPPEAPEDFYTRVAKKAKQKGLKFVLDTSGKALSAILEEGAYLLKPSIDELEDLTGTTTGNEQEQKELLLEVLNQYKVEIIVLSLGPKGALLAHGNSVEHFPAASVEARSSIGAGDSMLAGIIFSLSNGKSLTEALLFGSACGGATLKTPGTQLLHREDAERLFKKMMAERKVK